MDGVVCIYLSKLYVSSVALYSSRNVFLDVSVPFADMIGCFLIEERSELTRMYFRRRAFPAGESRLVSCFGVLGVRAA